MEAHTEKRTHNHTRTPPHTVKDGEKKNTHTSFLKHKQRLICTLLNTLTHKHNIKCTRSQAHTQTRTHTNTHTHTHTHTVTHTHIPLKTVRKIRQHLIPHTQRETRLACWTHTLLNTLTHMILNAHDPKHTHRRAHNHSLSDAHTETHTYR
jgi:hypothetical protein